MRRIVLVILAGIVLCLIAACTSLAAGRIDIEADSIEFSADGRVVSAAGRVTLSHDDLQLQAETLSCRGSIIQAAGGVILTTREGTLHADWLELNLDTMEIMAEGLHGDLNGFFVRARSIEPGDGDSQALREVGLTRCDAALPCYEILAGRIGISGNKVTIERGWLALKGRRFLPLPRMTMDLDHLDEWPSLNAGIDDRGLYVEAGLTVPVGDEHGLILTGTISSAEALALRTAFAWRPGDRFELQPWVSYSQADGWQGGLEAAASLGSLLAELETSYSQTDSRTTSSLTITGPYWAVSHGALQLAGFLTRDQGGSEPERLTSGATIAWTAGNSPRNRYRYDLSLGRTWSAGTEEPLIKVGAEMNSEFASGWGVDLAFSYDVHNDLWDAGRFGLVRRFHCYYVRLGYDWTDSVVSASAGIDF